MIKIIQMIEKCRFNVLLKQIKFSKVKMSQIQAKFNFSIKLRTRCKGVPKIPLALSMYRSMIDFL